MCACWWSYHNNMTEWDLFYDSKLVENTKDYKFKIYDYTHMQAVKLKATNEQGKQTNTKRQKFSEYKRIRREVDKGKRA